MNLAPPIEIRQEGDKWRRVMTHVEIRRVQNGFVVMGFNANPRLGDHDPQFRQLDRVCFVCETVESLCATISSLCTEAGDFAWAASVDIPITELWATRRTNE